MNTRFGILGTGSIVGKYAAACRLLPGLELVAIASRDADRVCATAAQLGIPRAHTGYDCLLHDPDVDAVIIALHNGLHCEWTCRALAAGKHVLCEKPLACNAGDAAQMFAAARTHRRWLMEAFMYRFHPQLPEILRRIHAGEIGRVLHINSHRMSQGREASNMRYQRDAGGGALLDIGCYCVSLAQAVTGVEPIRVQANAHFDPVTGVDLTLTGMLVFPEDVTANFCCSFESEPSYGAEIVGTTGRILIPNPWMPPVWPSDFTIVRAGKSEIIRMTPPEVPAHILAPFALELTHFAECIRQDRAPVFPPGDDAERASLGIARTLDSVIAAARV